MDRRYSMVFSSIWCLIFFLTVNSAAVWADFNLQTYRNRNSKDFIFLDSFRNHEDWQKIPFLNSFMYHYFHGPVSFEQAEDGNGYLVPAVHSLNFASEYAVSSKTAFGLDIPVHQIQYQGRGDTFSFGDIRAFAKHIFWKDKVSKISITPSLYLPTGNSSVLLSNSQGGGGAMFSADRKFERLMVAANLGVDYFPEAHFRNIDYSWQFSGGVGISYGISETWALSTELLNRHIDGMNLADFYLGTSHVLSVQTRMNVGASVAGKASNGDLIYRLMAGVIWQPGETRVVTKKVVKKVETVKKIKTVLDCGPKTYSRKFAARALTLEEQRKFAGPTSLPYRSSVSKPFTLKGIGDRADADQQVVFAVSLSELPERASVISTKSFDLKFSLSKGERKSSEQSDIICLLEQKICSGDYPTTGSYSSNVNASFFKGKEPPNDNFRRIIDQSSSKDVTIPIGKIVENSTLIELEDLAYLDRSKKENNGRTLYFAVARNLGIDKGAVIEVVMSIQVCKKGKPKPVVETIEQESNVTQEGAANE